MRLTGAARLAGVVGWPIAHSLSPRLHGYWLGRYGIDGAYVPLGVRPADFEAAFRALPKLGFRGVNLTVPHKPAALGLVDEVDAMAARIGAVNTVVFDSDTGRSLGLNTDAPGFLASLRAGAPDWRADAGPAVVLGAGGAARAVVVALLDAGTPILRLVNRTRDRAETLAARLGDGRVWVTEWRARADLLADAALVVNTTTLGMTGAGALDLDLDALAGDALVTDLVYSPLETPLLAAARARGNPVVDGLGMLLHQAAPGFAHWFGRTPEVDQGLRDAVAEGL